MAAVLHRAGQSSTADSQFVAGDLTVDLVSKRVWRGKQVIHLTPTKFGLLVAWMQRRGAAVTPEELVKAVWGEPYAEEIGYVRRYVWHLRHKLEPDPEHPRYIHNERGFGYRFEVQEA